MPYAITLRLDDADCAPVHTLLQALAASGITEPGRGHAPRITLVEYPDNADAKALAATAAGLSVQWKRLPVRFAHLGVSPGAPSALWLAPVTNSALLVRHAQLLARHPGSGPWASGAWVPHLMLNADLADTNVLAAATASASAAFAPFTATVSHVELIRTEPLELLFSGPLAEG